jgi:hypothetical protein
MTRTCNLEVEDSITGEPAEAELFAVGFHAHLLGIVVNDQLLFWFHTLLPCRVESCVVSCLVSSVGNKFIELHFVCLRVL